MSTIKSKWKAVFLVKSINRMGNKMLFIAIFFLGNNLGQQNTGIKEQNKQFWTSAEIKATVSQAFSFNFGNRAVLFYWTFTFFILYLNKHPIKPNPWIICVVDHNGLLKSELQVSNLEISLTNICKYLHETLTFLTTESGR